MKPVGRGVTVFECCNDVSRFLARRGAMTIELKLFFIVMDVLTLLVYPIIVMHRVNHTSFQNQKYILRLKINWLLTRPHLADDHLENDEQCFKDSWRFRMDITDRPRNSLAKRRVTS